MKMSDIGINWLRSKEDTVLDKNGNHVVYDDQTKQPVPDDAPLPPGATIGYGPLVKPGEDFRGGIKYVLYKKPPANRLVVFCLILRNA